VASGQAFWYSVGLEKIDSDPNSSNSSHRSVVIDPPLPSPVAYLLYRNNQLLRATSTHHNELVAAVARQPQSCENPLFSTFFQPRPWWLCSSN